MFSKEKHIVGCEKRLQSQMMRKSCFSFHIAKDKGESNEMIDTTVELSSCGQLLPGVSSGCS